jgi:hypothetical protein
VSRVMSADRARLNQLCQLVRLIDNWLIVTVASPDFEITDRRFPSLIVLYSAR